MYDVTVLDLQHLHAPLDPADQCIFFVAAEIVTRSPRRSATICQRFSFASDPSAFTILAPSDFVEMPLIVDELAGHGLDQYT